MKAKAHNQFLSLAHTTHIFLIISRMSRSLRLSLIKDLIKIATTIEVITPRDLAQRGSSRIFSITSVTIYRHGCVCVCVCARAFVRLVGEGGRVSKRENEIEE